MKYSYTDQERAKIKSVIVNGFAVKKTRDEVAHDLNKSGIKKTTGGAFTNGDVGNFCQTFGIRKYQRDTAPTVSKTTPVPKTPEKPKIDSMNLIQQITVSKILAPAEKIELIQRITLGEITEPEYTEKEIIDGSLYIENVSILRSKDDNPHVQLSKEQAQLILSNLAAINNFIEGKAL